MKIAKDSRVRQYELTYLIDAVSTEADRTKISDFITKAITKAKGEVVRSEDWGKRQLAYVLKIHGKEYREASYAHLVISLDASKTQELERELYLNEKIIRHLLVVAEDNTSSNEPTTEEAEPAKIESAKAEEAEAKPEAEKAESESKKPAQKEAKSKEKKTSK